MENQTKICIDCLQEKPNILFRTKKNGRGIDYYQNRCRDCHNTKCRKRHAEIDKTDLKKVRTAYYEKNKARCREWSKKSAQKNKEAYTRRAISHRNKKTDWFWSIIKPECAYCGYSKSKSALQFHHTDRNQKKHNRDTLSVWVRKVSFDQLKENIKNTSFVILCANCHAELHAGDNDIDKAWFVLAKKHVAGDGL